MYVWYRLFPQDNMCTAATEASKFMRTQKFIKVSWLGRGLCIREVRDAVSPIVILGKYVVIHDITLSGDSSKALDLHV